MNKNVKLGTGILVGAFALVVLRFSIKKLREMHDEAREHDLEVEGDICWGEE